MTAPPVRILVDAAQSVGSLPLNLTELEQTFIRVTSGGVAHLGGWSLCATGSTRKFAATFMVGVVLSLIVKVNL